MRLQPILKQIHDAGSGNRRMDGEIGRPADGHEQRPGRINADNLAGALELPRQNRTAVAEAAAQASVVEQLARVRRPAATVEVSRSGGARKALNARTDRHRDHVLLEDLVIANSGVT